jgi:hypothetical protein
MIQTLHTLVGIGAIALMGALGARYRTLKRGEAKPSTGISNAAALRSSRLLKGHRAPPVARYSYAQYAKHRERRKERRCNRFW